MTNLYEYKHPIINSELASSDVDGSPRKFPTLEAWQDVINDYEFQARCPIILRNSHKNKHFTFACHLKGCPFKILLSLCNEDIGVESRDENNSNNNNGDEDHNRGVRGNGVENDNIVEDIGHVGNVDECGVVTTAVASTTAENSADNKVGQFSNEDASMTKAGRVDNGETKIDIPLIHHQEGIFEKVSTLHRQGSISDDVENTKVTGYSGQELNQNGCVYTNHGRSGTHSNGDTSEANTESTELRGREILKEGGIRTDKHSDVGREEDILDVDAEVRELMRVHKDVAEAVAASGDSTTDDVDIPHAEDRKKYLETETTDATVTAAIAAAVAAVQEPESLLRPGEDSLLNTATEEGHGIEPIGSETIKPESGANGAKHFPIPADGNFLTPDYPLLRGTPFHLRQVDGPFVVTKIEPYHNHSLEDNLPLTKFVLTKVPKILQNELDFDVLLENMFTKGNHTLSKFKVSQYVESSGLLKIIKDRYHLSDGIINKKFTSLISRKVTTYKARFVLKKKRSGDYNKLPDTSSFLNDGSVVTPDSLSSLNHERTDDSTAAAGNVYSVDVPGEGGRSPADTNTRKQGEEYLSNQPSNAGTYTDSHKRHYRPRQHQVRSEYQNLHPKTKYQLTQEGLLSHDDDILSTPPSDNESTEVQDTELHSKLHDSADIDIAVGATEVDQRNVPKRTLENGHEELDGYESHKRHKYDYSMKDTSLDDGGLPALDDISDDRLPHEVAEQLKLLSSHFKEVESSALQAVRNVAMEDEGDIEPGLEQERGQAHAQEGSQDLGQNHEDSVHMHEHLVVPSGEDVGDSTDSNSPKDVEKRNADGDGEADTYILHHPNKLGIVADVPEDNIQPELRG